MRNDETKAIITTVLAETEDIWNAIFSPGGGDYEEPRLQLFTGQVRSARSFASVASGPFYFPGDKQIYIDLSSYDELHQRFDAPGDFAHAHVPAHEVGRHVQNLLGVLPQFSEARRRSSETDANALSVWVGPQADCYAGGRGSMWLNRTLRKKVIWMRR